MCRNIRVLFNFDPPVTEEEIRAAALQYVRKVSGATKPARHNQAAFDAAVEAIAGATRDLMGALTTQAAPRTREEEARKAKERAAEHYGSAKPSAIVDQQ
jgi:hypothetical protein